MEIHQKIKSLREFKKFSQEHLAHELGLSQSQYSRRENGEVKFMVDEISKIAKLLETTVSHLYGEETNTFTVHTQNGGNFAQFISLPDKLIELYEARLNEKDEIIRLLKNR